MMAPSFADLGTLHWEFVAIPLAIGVVSAGLAVVVSRLLSGRQRVAAPPPEPPPVEQSDPFTHGGSMEKRSALRRQGNPVEVAIADSEGQTELTRGWVVDRSTGGLCLSLFQPLDVGSVVNVRPCRVEPAPPWVRVEVRKCRRQPDGWEVGCQFVRTPPWSVLLLFG
jgi:hypothetical protein